MDRSKKQQIITYIRKHAGKMQPLDMANELKVKESFIINTASQNKISLKIPDKQADRLKDFLLKHHSEMTCGEMVVRLRKWNITANKIYALANRLRVDLKREEGYGERQIKMADRNGYFNEMAHETWLV